MPYKDIEKRRALAREYSHRVRAANPEKYRARCRKWYADHLEDARGIKRADWKKHPVRSLPSLFNILRAKSAARGLPMDLSFDEYVALTSADCCYCHGPLPKSGYGLDRKNSSLGYSIENCVPCCKTCNRIRGEDDISYEEMFEVMKLLQRLRRKNAA